MRPICGFREGPFPANDTDFLGFPESTHFGNRKNWVDTPSPKSVNWLYWKPWVRHRLYYPVRIISIDNI